ncbi:bifunctional UDP-N-acetylglucosamine pyrophosphorylase / Glucosamine-1-phosphate N-acetyltransferase [Nitrosomonas sp. Nm51]|uniref:bifunctional UDP-N-acetylglucosamine diphosphorylase/glucosamine-1-phosphate N-acetyltransferase GlmU n=1 Tax=Nitrosomonas sp. Nm51 TaxID=133720 RepID=UPI0008B110BC|nr:bifunctional UDP-N-acetylglucosamine diphosphorylase/glucosamine-1-phosphate N-acetyltransferase GlmU [Nitrosomonas sp. Nm51]SER28885.1 bifunctional UDP-N-acetylglucosamine pyrophosphorylase / Glucosamine-1-phosphate N-acetyltransferase [Nitrosomonas sp. Nm51]
MASKLSIIILAAGLGKRMHSSLPKVLHALAGKPLLSHVLDLAKKLSPDQICVVIGHGGERVKEIVNDASLTWVTQEPQLGTGHAVLQAQPYLDQEGSTLILYGDVPLVSLASLEQLINSAQGKTCGILTAVVDDPFGYGRIIRDENTNAISGIVEQKDTNQTQQSIREINTGIMVIPNACLHSWLPKLKDNNAQQEYYLTDIVKMAVGQNVAVVSTQAVHDWEILGVNSRVQLAELERIYQNNYANKLLEKGVMLYDPARIDIRGELRCGTDVEIDVNCIFEGTVILGDHVKVKANSILKDVTVSEKTAILPFSHIEDAKIGANCRIGPYSRIRPETQLTDNVHIGNFVEVKKSQIASGSKVNHLSYIGDTAIGNNVNIGAGTITCNYDGAYKHQTIIEDNVFIGSDTQLVAPVKVSYGSTIGAGSTITKDTPENELTLSRAKQISISGWKRPSKT